MAEYSYFYNVISSLLRGMNSDAPWQQYVSANRVTGSGFWFVFNLFGRFVLMRMFLESVAVSQVHVLAFSQFLVQRIEPPTVQLAAGEIRGAGACQSCHINGFMWSLTLGCL